MSDRPYLPGKAIILSRLPAKDWFSLEEAAKHSGWSRTFIRRHITSGTLAAQACQRSSDKPASNGGKYATYRVHVDDLVVFILKNGGSRYSEERPFRDIVSIIRLWPAWMIRELQKVLNRMLPAPDAQVSVPPDTPPTKPNEKENRG